MLTSRGQPSEINLRDVNVRATIIANAEARTQLPILNVVNDGSSKLATTVARALAGALLED
ncbi:hypothetical protein AcV5_001467 [Taiwanofungus camphoratus]|nr:hypothetical protein AcV5_001467 [Antrodia cinnamomea]